MSITTPAAEPDPQRAAAIVTARPYAPNAPESKHCGARDDGYICTAADGHALDHAAYESSHDTRPVHTWPARIQQAGPPALAPYDSSVTDEAGAVDPDPAETARRAASVAALRDLGNGYIKLAAAIEAHPAIPAPYLSSFADAYVLLCAGSAEQDVGARALPCTLRKEADEKYFELHGDLGGLDVQLYAAREKVCTITGYEDREVDEVVAPAVTEKVTKSMPVWECAPILAPRPAAEAAL